MTPLLTLNSQAHAHSLANYLTSQGIAATVMTRDAHEYEICLTGTPPADMDRVRQICETFLREPNHPRYRQAAWQSGEGVNLQRSSSGTTTRILSQARQAPFTAVIFVICTLVYGLSLLGWFAPLYDTLTIQPLGMLAQNHEWWRLLGPVFLHFSALHFVFNLLWWGMLGAQIERVLGISMLLLVFAVSAITSNLAQLLVSGPNFGGMSGVVYALLGFIWWLGWLRPSWGLSLPKSIIGFMLVWLVVGYADVLWVNMANTAHTVGLISGCALAAILALGNARRGRAA